MTGLTRRPLLGSSKDLDGAGHAADTGHLMGEGALVLTEPHGPQSRGSVRIPAETGRLRGGGVGAQHGTAAFGENRWPRRLFHTDEFYFLSCSCPSEVIPSMSLDKNTAFALQAVSSCCRGPGRLSPRATRHHLVFY